MDGGMAAPTDGLPPQNGSPVHRRANFPDGLNLSPSSSPDRLGGLEGSETSKRRDIERFGIAGRTWHASYALLNYLMPAGLASRPSSTWKTHAGTGDEDDQGYLLQFDPPSPLSTSLKAASAPRLLKILDLGSGTGHLPIGLVERLCEPNHFESKGYDSIEIIATDLPEVLPLLERNTSRRRIKECLGLKPGIELIVKPLSWGDSHQTIKLMESIGINDSTDLVITCSDLIFFPFLFGPLIHTLLVLTSSNHLNDHITPMILIGYKERSAVKEYPFFSLIGRYFKLEPILSRWSSSEPWQLIRRRTQVETGEEEEEELENSQEDHDQIYLLKLTRLQSTLDLDLSFLYNNQTDNRNLTDFGVPSGVDQWELILFSNLAS